jgi:hypothetical protein
VTLLAPATLDVALAARRHLAALPACRAVLGPTGSDVESSVWLFTRTLSVVVEGSSRAAAVLSVAGGWARPNEHNTAQFPRLQLEIFADASRTSGTITCRDAEARAWAAWHPFNEELHRLKAFSEIWGAKDSDPGLRVWGCQLTSHPDTFDLPDWDGGKRLLAHYGLCTG